MREVKRLPLCDQRRNIRPSSRLSRIRKKVHDNRPLLDRFRDIEERLPRNPTVFLGLFPRFAAFTDTDNDVYPVVSGVEGLTVALGAVAYHGEGVVLEVAGTVSEDNVLEKLLVKAGGQTHSWSLSRGQSARS